MSHSPLSFMCVPFRWLCIQFFTSLCCECLVVCSKCLVVCNQMKVCVCHLKIWLCVPNENTSSILGTVKRFDGKEYSWKRSVRVLLFVCYVLSFVCAVLRMPLGCEKCVLTIVKNCILLLSGILLRSSFQFGDVR